MSIFKTFSIHYKYSSRIQIDILILRVKYIFVFTICLFPFSVDYFTISPFMQQYVPKLFDMAFLINDLQKLRNVMSYLRKNV